LMKWRVGGSGLGRFAIYAAISVGFAIGIPLCVQAVRVSNCISEYGIYIAGWCEPSIAMFYISFGPALFASQFVEVNDLWIAMLIQILSWFTFISLLGEIYRAIRKKH
jgi:hypothetical protein